MRRTIKFAVLFAALAVCVLGVAFSPHEVPAQREMKTHVVPVKNSRPVRPAGLRV